VTGVVVVLAWVQGAMAVVLLGLVAAAVIVWAKASSGPAAEPEPVLNDVPGGGIMQFEEPNDVTWQGGLGFRIR
jgi:hypothetical protein